MIVSSCRLSFPRNSSYLLSSTPVIISSTVQSSTISQYIDGEWIVNILSSIIFVLSFLGNLAALLVMLGSRGPIRLTNNKYLVNLACADLFRACFMPFTIIARMKKNFLFGPLMCKILPIVQGLSVAVDVFTLVCISIERYIAICRPLLILKLQSLRFSNLLNALTLFCIWSFALLTALPNLFMYNLCSLPRPNKFKCEKVQPKYFDGKIYMIIILMLYLVIPLFIMVVLYTLIICKMYKNSTAMRMRSFQCSNPSKTMSISSSPPVQRHSISIPHQRTQSDCHRIECKEENNALHSPPADRHRRLSFGTIRNSSTNHSEQRKKSIFSTLNSRFNSSWPKHVDRPSRRTSQRYRGKYSYPMSSSKENHLLNSSESRSNSNRSQSSSGLNPSMYRMDRHRRKALRLLIVLIVEFFICWTPLFLYHMFGTYFKTFYRRTPAVVIDLILLFSFASALTNPLTYYFMSKRYRSVLFAYLTCFRFRRHSDDEYRSQKKQEAMQMIKALRLHQQQNSLEYQRKNSLNLHPNKSHSNTLH